MPTLKMLSNSDGATTLNYTDKEKPGNGEPRVLHSAGLLCNPNTAVDEFRRVRERHGKQDATRRAPASYTLPDPGEVATHVRRESRAGRRSWGIAKDGETATHIRREGLTFQKLARGEGDGTHRRLGRQWVEADAHEATHRVVVGGHKKEREVLHLIYSFGLHEVNPDEPDDVLRAFDTTVAMIGDLFPGAMAKLVGQADSTGALDGTGKAKFHVHVVLNATVVKRMELDGEVWEPGRKLSGALTDIERVRDRADAFLREHPENGFEPLGKSSRDRKAEIRRDHDNRVAAKGGVSTDDRLRDAYEAALEEMIALHSSGHPVGLDGLSAALDGLGVETKHSVTKSGRNKGKETLSLRTTDMPVDTNGNKRWRRGAELGAHFTLMDTTDRATGEVIPGIRSQLDAITRGEEPERRPARVQAGAPKPVRVPTPDELSEARTVVDELARSERLERMDEDFSTASIVDFDAAGEARFKGDHEVMARLAQIYRDRRAVKKAAVVPQPKTKATTPPGGKVTPAPVAKPVTEPRQPTWEEKTAAMFAEIDAQTSTMTSTNEDVLRRAGIGRKPAEPAVTPDEAAPAAVQSTEDRPAEDAAVAIHREAMDELSPQEAEPDRVDEVALVLPFRGERSDGESSAAAPDYRRVPASAAAPAATSKPKKYRSPLRSVVVKSEQTQAVIDKSAALDESARDALLRGDRIDESTVPKGIGPQFLSNYGDKFDPGVLEQLRLREKKKRQVDTLHVAKLFDAKSVLLSEIQAGVYEHVAKSRFPELGQTTPSPQRGGLGD